MKALQIAYEVYDTHTLPKGQAFKHAVYETIEPAQECFRDDIKQGFIIKVTRQLIESK